MLARIFGHADFEASSLLRGNERWRQFILMRGTRTRVINRHRRRALTPYRLTRLVTEMTSVGDNTSLGVGPSKS